jgi:hypothetical protein
LLLISFHLLEDFRAVAHTYAELLTLKRGHFEQVLKFFPQEQNVAKKAHAKLAFSAGIRYLAKKAKEDASRGFGSMVELSWLDEKKHESDVKNVHLGQDDANPDWDGFEHLNLVGMTSYKVDRMEERVMNLLEEMREEFGGHGHTRGEPKSSDHDGEQNSGDSGEPLPEPGQSNLPENIVTWEGMRPFLNAVEKMERKMDTIIEQQADTKKALDLIRSKVSVPKDLYKKQDKGNWCNAPTKG